MLQLDLPSPYQDKLSSSLRMTARRVPPIISTMPISPQARLTYIALASLRSTAPLPSPPLHARTRRPAARHLSTTPRVPSGHFSRSDFNNQPFTGVYEPGGPTGGPLDGVSTVGAPRITPRVLKEHLDQFVVGQERAKKVLSVAVYNHYQRVRELERRDAEVEEMAAQQARRELGRHPVEDEFPDQQTTQFYPAIDDDIRHDQPPRHAHSRRPLNPHVILSEASQTHPLHPQPTLPEPPTLEKSNVLLLGPTGVGKTLLAKTLARALDVPFSISDCTPFTQAGYIGEDADVCVARLLAAADYDVTRAERGIIVLDEIDKIATRRVTGGRDVGGEGVQQALLKIVEGTTLQIHAKPEKGGSGSRGGQSGGGPGPGFPSNPVSGSVNTSSNMGGGGGGGKGEVFNVRTDNILFIFTGAFIGLHKMILSRISSGSIGFGADPKNCLVAQYAALFALSGIKLRFTRPALIEIARTALRLGTGARGLRSVMEGVLGEAMFEAPGGTTRHVVVVGETARLEGPAVCLARGMGGKVEEVVGREEREWEGEWEGEREAERVRREGRVGARVSTFEEYRNGRYGEVAGGMG
ncbi:hypothetical protein P152DRAFT_508943 [Eremomyces bilateralis CBS 781.70]|uniref:P-loop containing nucleoside triphosphate hydrolase protein n=1 Tax=Eremomyces bilateralis CBS 781.70 TaxID=1392243 RepID=A0A6G1FW83_9PEZI|nr:uncharacterized protein P152DRAFT_508943 [Eremomyces bilateralis CBS 781.70]KAF1810097.1 hypothetical protein P152DRAFT_508943 [Eremomyces bilateralis CBS 781.70]